MENCHFRLLPFIALSGDGIILLSELKHSFLVAVHEFICVTLYEYSK